MTSARFAVMATRGRGLDAGGSGEIRARVTPRTVFMCCRRTSSAFVATGCSHRRPRPGVRSPAVHTRTSESSMARPHDASTARRSSKTSSSEACRLSRRCRPWNASTASRPTSCSTGAEFPSGAEPGPGSGGSNSGSGSGSGSGAEGAVGYGVARSLHATPHEARCAAMVPRQPCIAHLQG